MTRIRLGLTVETATGRVQTGGRIILSPHRRYSTAPGEPTDIVLPADMPVALTYGGDAPVVELDPRWVWRGVERPHPGAGITRTVMVPDTEAVVDWADLVDVDPESLEPTPEALEGWSAVLAEVGEHRSAAASAAQSAVQSAGWADAAELAAQGHAATAQAAAAAANLTIDHDPRVGWIITQGAPNHG